jgi:catechol 2,3-dioxygenase-like lactoylglutathione lyase family enzyme
MRQHLFGIDHAVVATPDLDAAARQYQAMGFKLLPRGIHTVGSVNHCIMFGGGDYFELFGVPQGARVAPAFLRFLEHGPGLVSAVLATDDALAAKEELARAGIEAGEVRDFSRQVDMPGAHGRASFRTLDMPAAHTPGLHVFCCQHYTRELVWTPGSDDHPNSVQAIHSVLLCSSEPRRDAQAYAGLLDCEPALADGLYQLNMKGASLCIGGQGALEAVHPGITEGIAHPFPCAVGICFKVASIERARALLTANGIAYRALNADRLMVDAKQAQGVSVLFCQLQ